MAPPPGPLKPERSREMQEFGLAVGELLVLRIDSLVFLKFEARAPASQAGTSVLEIRVGSLGVSSGEAAGTCPACACGDQLRV